MKLFLFLLCLSAFVFSLSGSAIANGGRPSAIEQSIRIHSDSLTLSPSTVLTTTNGSWTNNPTTFSYQWMDCNANGTNCANIGGATAVSYTVISGDIGFAIEVSVTATNASGHATQHSAPTGVITIPPTNTTPPVISGTVQANQVLTAFNGTWANSPTSYTYQWQRCTTNSSGCATIASSPITNSYTLVVADVGKYIRVGVSASNSAGTSAYAYSAETIAVAPSGSPPANTTYPSVTGAATVGSVESAVNGTWTGSPTSYTYQWGKQAPCAPGPGTNINGATGATYTPVTADIGFQLYVAVTASNAFGSATTFSTCSGAVVAGGGGGGGGGGNPAGYTGPCTQTINPGSSVDPIATANNMSSGQILCLNSGTYLTSPGPELDLNASGITITSAPGQAATINGAEYIYGNNDTLQYLNLDEADSLYNGNGGANPAPCPYPTSEGMIIWGSNNTLQYNNIYESRQRGVLIGVNYGSGSVANNDIIRYNNLGPAGECGHFNHLVYADYTNNLQVYGNWGFDNPFGYGVQLFVSPSNSRIYSNVFDNVIAATVEASSSGGNQTYNNVGINSPAVAGYASGEFVDCYSSTGPDTITNNAIFNNANGFGSTSCGGVSGSGNITLAANPFVGGRISDNYTLANNASATAISGYGLWNGVGPPSPNPALSYPPDPVNPGNGNPGIRGGNPAFEPPHVLDASMRQGLRQYRAYLARHHRTMQTHNHSHGSSFPWVLLLIVAIIAILSVLALLTIRVKK